MNILDNKGNCARGNRWFGLVVFYGILTLASYLMSNAVCLSVSLSLSLSIYIYIYNLQANSWKVTLFLNEPVLIYLNTVQWLHILPFKIHNSIWSISTTTPNNSGPGSNGNAEVLHDPQSSRIKASAWNSLVSYQDAHLSWGFTPLLRYSRPILRDHRDMAAE